MATLRQKMALKEIVENGRSTSAAMRAVGYSPRTAVDPGKLTRSKGFRELCEDCGLTDNLILKSLVSDIKKKPKRRKAELELAAKIKGLLKEEQPGGGGTVINIINYAESDRIHRAVQLAGGAPPLDGAPITGQIQDDSVASQSEENDTSNQRTFSLGSG